MESRIDKKSPVAGASLQVQTIVYCLEKENIFRTLEHLRRSFELAKLDGILDRMSIRIGDTSPDRCLGDEDLQEIAERTGFWAPVEYLFFGQNIGSAAGHNRLAEGADADFLMILNPDVVVSPRTLGKMLEPFSSGSTGMTEARQLPIEHPKDYNPTTGETGWATTACAITPRSLFEEIGGFDSESFFLYCDDVDYSWMVREKGKKVIFLPHATVFHDKRLGKNGEWIPSGAEVFYSAQAALLMAHKWSHREMLEKILSNFENGSPPEQDARRNYLERKEAGRLPEPRDSEHKIGELTKNFLYTKHRFHL